MDKQDNNLRQIYQNNEILIGFYVLFWDNLTVQCQSLFTQLTWLLSVRVSIEGRQSWLRGNSSRLVNWWSYFAYDSGPKRTRCKIQLQFDRHISHLVPRQVLMPMKREKKTAKITAVGPTNCRTWTWTRVRRIKLRGACDVAPHATFCIWCETGDGSD